MAVRGYPQLNDPPGPRDHHQEHAEHRGEKQRDPKRQVPVSTEVADGDSLPVLQDEDQQQEQDERAKGGGYPEAAHACPLDTVVRQFDGARVLSLRYRRILAGLPGVCRFCCH
jgi:hypothetical protein